MSETMTHKQLYLPRRLNQFLKRAARQRGISKSEGDAPGAGKG